MSIMEKYKFKISLACDDIVECIARFKDAFFGRRPQKTPRTVRGLGRLCMILQFRCDDCGHRAMRSPRQLIRSYGARKRLDRIRPVCGCCGSTHVQARLLPVARNRPALRRRPA